MELRRQESICLTVINIELLQKEAEDRQKMEEEKRKQEDIMEEEKEDETVK